MKMSYLIDQQCSETLVVTKKEKPSYQPIVIRKDISMVDSSDVVMELSREQALGLAAMLTKVAKGCKKVDGTRCEYPGYVLSIEGFEQRELDATLAERGR